jgi:hypothetical protein
MASAHEIFCVLPGTIDVKTVLKATGHRFFDQAPLKIFDALFFRFTDHLGIRTAGIIPNDLNILDDIFASPAGITSFDVGFNQLANGTMDQFNLVGPWIDETGNSDTTGTTDYPSPMSPSPSNIESVERLTPLLNREK